MLKNFRLVESKITECEADQALVQVFLKPEPEQMKMLIEEYKIDDHTLNSALDPDEISRLEFEDNHVAVILKSPKNYSSGDNLIFKVTSIGLFLFKEKLIIVLPEDLELFERRQTIRLHTLHDIFLKVIYGTISHFLGHLKVIDMISGSLEDKINDKMENKFLINMFKIEKSLIYYINAINSNAMLFDKLKLNAAKIGIVPENIEFLEDIIIENSQCSRQAAIYSNVITGLMQTRGSIVNNNLNMLIKRLTILSVVFMPLNLIAGIGGMSEYSVMTQSIGKAIAYISLSLVMLLIGFGTYYLLKWLLDNKNDGL